jgi:hypothetical protein
MLHAAADVPRTHLPLNGHPIDIVVAGGWRLPVSCSSDITAPDVQLAPLSAGAALPCGAEQVAATLEWRSCAGLVRRSGVLVADGDAFVLTQAGQVEVVQRRRYARVRSRLRVVVAGTNTDGDLPTRTVDLSIGGMLIEQAGALQLGERVRFTLGLPDQGDVVSTGVVARVLPFGYRAIAFDGLRPGDEQRVSRYVFAQEREGRSVAAYAGP